MCESMDVIVPDWNQQTGEITEQWFDRDKCEAQLFNFHI